MITNFGNMTGAVNGDFYASGMTGMVQVTDSEFINNTGQTILVIFQKSNSAAIGAPAASSSFNDLTDTSTTAAYVHFGILSNGGYIDYETETINYFWMAA